MNHASIPACARSGRYSGSRRSLAVAVLLIVLLSTAVALTTSPVAAAQEVSSEPDTSTWVTNGAVYAILCHGGITYIGGDFTRVGPVGGTMVTRNHIAAIDEDTGQATAWNPNANDIVRAFCGFGDSSIIAGGDFSSIGGNARKFIAELNISNGQATSWNPGTNGLVLSVCNNNGWIWAGGMFTEIGIGGSSTDFVGAIWGPGSSNAGYAAWTTNLHCDDWIFALANGMVGGYSQVFFGGSFTNLQAQPRNHIARTLGPSIADWNPNANDLVSCLNVSGSKVYAGGTFTRVGGSTRNRIAAVDTTTGQATSWNPNANNQVIAVAASGSTVYAGGSFTSIGGQSRSQIAALDATTGKATSWNPNVNQSVRAIAVSDSYVYVGGYFTTVGGSSRPYFARFALTDAQSTWYLAEGSTAWGFFEYVCIENPNKADVSARVTYMTETGNIDGGVIVLPKESQTSINPKDAVGEKDFSVKVECLDPSKTIAVDRAMSWWATGTQIAEGHSSIGVTAPARDWYLPEGSSAWGFECWLLIQNPNPSQVSCDVTYMIEGEGAKTFKKTIPANSRKTFNMAEDIGAKDASIKVSCASPVIPERAMYRNNRRMGHDSIGTTQPNKKYYLAEGTSAWGFTTYVLIQNPNNAETSVNITYMTDKGPVAHPQNPIKMPANSRKTIRVNDFLPDKDFSTLVEGNNPIISERAMYWDNGTGEAGHDSIGMAAPHTTFYLPSGTTYAVAQAQTYTLVQNPGTSDVKVRVTYLPSGGQGSPVSFDDTVPSNSRKTYNMADKGSFEAGASVKVECLTTGGKIMVERAMYWYNKGSGNETIGGFSD